MGVTLKEKSSINTIAAGKLQEENLHAPSVHCSYYRCFQLSTYILYHVHDYSDSSLDIDRTQQSRPLGIHEHRISKLYNHLNDIDIDNTADVYYDNIMKLKKLRKHADYSNTIEINSTKSKMAEEIANKVMLSLNKVYKNNL